MEIWKDIKGFKKQYQISNYGNVRSLDREIKQICSKSKDKFQINHLKGKELKKKLINSGYFVVSLSKDGHSKNYLIHRLVALHFLDYSDNDIVNHKDEDKLNNHVLNLEWCTPKYNANYGERNKKLSKRFGKIIFQYDLNFNLINTYNNSLEASYITKIPDRGIRKSCVSTKPYKNYYWRHEKYNK